MMTFKDAERLFRVRPGSRVRLKDHDPSWAGGGEFKELRSDELKARAKAFLAKNIDGAGRGAGTALCQRRLLGPDRVAGDGCGRQGRHHQARHVGHQSAGLPGVQFQEAVGRGARPQLSLAIHARAARTRPDRHLQPLVLRGCSGRPRAPGDPRSRQKLPPGKRGQTFWHATVRRHQPVRAAPRHATAR